MRPILVLLLATLACSNPSSPDSGLKVETSVSASTARAGESITVNVHVTNLGLNTRSVAPACPGPFNVLTPSGERVDPSEPLCALILIAVTELGPGESRTFSGQLGAVRPTETVGYSWTTVPPGTYQVQGFIGDMQEGTAITGNSREVSIEG